VSSIVIQGDTSGSITVEAPSVAGTHTLTLPKATGNIATDATVGLGMKNLIINGDMRIAQRGTSATSLTTNSYTTVDRWKSIHGVGLGVWTDEQSTDVPSGQGFSHSFKATCTTADSSPSAGDIVQVIQEIEGQNMVSLKKGTANAESVTLSFWVKSNVTGTYTIEWRDSDNNRHICASYSITASDTWEKKTITFAGDTVSAFVYDNSTCGNIGFCYGAGSNFTSGTLATSWASRNTANLAVGQVNVGASTSNYFQLTGVQLEVGENATPFENRMYGTELALCQRYYYKWANGTISSYVGLGVGGISTTNTVEFMVKFPVTMRTTPSLDVSNISSSIQVYANAVSNISTINTNALISNPEAIMCNGTTSGLTTGNPAVIYANNNTSVYASASAEL
jgi:hypothetical protein